jgi:NAD(P)-dependent dehydrogenase (short-subunit alcohol dehydrogenase family)
MNQARGSTRTATRIVGGLFLGGFLTYGAGSSITAAILAAPNAAGNIAGNPLFAVGAVLMLANSAVVLGIALLLFPILKRHSTAIGVGYLITRAFEAVVLALGVIGLWSFGARATAANTLAYNIAMVGLGFGSLFFCAVLLRTRLVPSFLALWGLIGYVAFAAGSVLEILGIAGSGLVAAIPGGLFEVFFGIWLIFRGFNRTALDQTPTAGWGTSGAPDLTGKTIVITGASSGIGLEAARAFAADGAHVVLAVRDVAKGRAAAAAIVGSTEVRRLDLADLASVREFASDWCGDIEVLVNNAGVMVPPFGHTKDGFELQFGTNHLGHFALTNLLLPQITGRVVTIASSVHRSGRIDFDDLNFDGRPYRSGSAGYSQSKLANLLFTLELQRRLEAAGSGVIATAAHPGMAATNLNSSSTNPVLKLVGSVAVRIVAQDAAAGAWPTLFAATAPIRGGSYAGPSGRRGMSGPPTLVSRSAAAGDGVAAARLWAASEQLTGIRFPFDVSFTRVAARR